jgi:glutathione synthase
MSVNLGVVMDPVGAIDYKKDSTLAMLWAAADRGWNLFYLEQTDLQLEQGRAMGHMAPMEVFRDPGQWHRLGEREKRPLADLDVILMRKDPPFDTRYIYSTYTLEAAENDGVLVVNRPRSLRDCNEKVFATGFGECCPPVLVTANPEEIRNFHSEHKDMILKPLDGMGGQSIFRVKEDDLNLGVIMETLIQGNTPIMAQKYLPEIADGDKRILMINGEPISHCLARIPMAGENRGNLAAGGTGEVRPLSDRDQWIAAQVGPALRERGILFAGLDVIGDYLTEVNVTSPTCIREIDAACGTDIGASLMETIAAALEAKAGGN